MVLPIPKKHIGHMGHNPPHSDPLPNSDLIPEDYTPGAEGNPEWWEYLEAEDEDDYNHEMQNLKRIREQDGANLDIYYTDDDSSAFFGCTYDEIIAMYENGVVIPTEVLNWAQSMAQNDVSSETVTVQADDAEALYLSLKQSPNVNLKTIVQIFADKCKEHEQELDAYGEELTSLLKDVGVMRNKIEMLKEDAQKETEPLKDEWEDISYKLSHGIELTPKEQERAQYLKGKFGEIDANFRSQISSEIANIGIYLDKIGEVSQKIEIANSYSRVSKTILDEMSNPEASNASAGMITGSDLETEETLNNEDINANFTTTLHNAVYAMDNSVTNTGNISDSVMNILEESAEIGGFQLDDPDHTVTTSFSEDVDLSILEDNNNPKSGDPEETGDKGGDPNPPRGGEPTDNDNPEVIPEETPTGDTPDAGNPTNGTTQTGGTTGNGAPTGGTNPTGGNTQPNVAAGDNEYGYVTQSAPTQTNNTPKGNTPTNHKSDEEEKAENADSLIGSTNAMREEGKSGLGQVKSDTTDVKSKTKGTKTDASTSSNHKKASAENEKQAKKDLKKLQQEEQKYNKKLDSLQKNIEKMQKEVEESESRIEELHSTAQVVQEQDSDDEDENNNKQEELAAISQEMSEISDETKAKTSTIDKSINTQKTDRKKMIDTSKKAEKSFNALNAIGKSYQGTNDTIQNTASTVGKVSGSVTTAGQITKNVGNAVTAGGEVAKMTGKILLPTIYAYVGGILLKLGIVTKTEGEIIQKVGKYAQYAGSAGTAASTATTYIATSNRTSIDSFTDTAASAKTSSQNINKDVKKTQDDIKAANKDNAEMKKKIAEFQAEAMDVANMGGAGGLTKLHGGGSDGTNAASAMSATGNAGGGMPGAQKDNGAVTGNAIPEISGTKGNNETITPTGTTPGASFGTPDNINGNEVPEEGANPAGTDPTPPTGNTGADFGANPNGGITGGMQPSNQATPTGTNITVGKDDEEPENTPPEPGLDTDLPEFEDMAIEVNMDDEEPSPEFGYNPEGIKSYEKQSGNYTPSKKPYIKAPEETFNQTPNKGKKR